MSRLNVVVLDYLGLGLTVYLGERNRNQYRGRAGVALKSPDTQNLG